jgi:hypothetical protein
MNTNIVLDPEDAESKNNFAGKGLRQITKLDWTVNPQL